MTTGVYERWLTSPQPERERFELCFDRVCYAQRLGEHPTLPRDDRDPLVQYFQGPEYAEISPNPLFDEGWYRNCYADVRRAVAGGACYSGFLHFVRSGLAEGRAPNPYFAALISPKAGPPPIEKAQFDAAAYLRDRPEARAFIRHFPVVDAWDVYSCYGHRMGHAPALAAPDLGQGSPAARLLRSRFDADHYRGRHMAGAPANADPFEHYLAEGARAGHDPNAWFDEAWYLAYYADAREGVERGEHLNGFHHYLAVGAAQARMPRFDFKPALEGRMPRVTDPVLLSRAEELEKRIRPLLPETRERESPRVWFVLNTLNPDIAFGGYQAAFELIKAVVRSGREIGVVVTEDPLADKEYFAYRKDDPELVEAILAAPLVNHRRRQETLALHPDDVFVCFSVWDLWSTRDAVARTRRGRPILVIQEHEPIFYEHGSHRAMAVEGYGLPHVPVFNSGLLRDYFEANRIGVFAGGAPPAEGGDYHVFEHVPVRLKPAAAADGAGKDHRTLAFYARPEAHAARNLFEIGLAALRHACRSGVFDARWRFVGLGGLQEPMRLALGGGHELELVQKMPIEDYERFVTDIDVALSLMYAPHPGVTHFEFAAAGALVVTNTFENRPAELLTSLSANILPCAPTIDGVHAALAAAAERAEDFAARWKNRLILPDLAWPDVFSPAFVETMLGTGDAGAGRRRDAAE